MTQERQFGAIRQAIPSDAWMFPVAARGLSAQADCAPSPVRDQGDLGACVGFAFGCALNSMHGAGLITAPLALYYDFRTQSGFPADQDTGAFIQPALSALVQFGAGSEVTWPYEVDKFATRPSMTYKRQALDHRVSKHYRATSAVQAKTAVSNGLPVVVAFNAPPNFVKDTGASGVWADNGRATVGGHATCIMGYDDTKHDGAFRVQNSWSTEWGEDGFFWLPYDVYEGQRFWDGAVVTTWDMEAGS